ncbi:MAG: group 1 truncated hemoglobin [Ketobacter sp.]|nr:MAG: group 1 truncated hemoglobin [Ketobacter sp.]
MKIMTSSAPATCTAALVLMCNFLLSACQTAPAGDALYQELGGMEGITEITDNFIYEIGFDENIVRHFQETNLDRFREKFIEQVCEVSGGPCTYSGDSMVEVHTNMNVTEAEFNRTVDLLVAAMNRSGIPHPVQNQLLARLAPTRPDIIYK